MQNNYVELVGNICGNIKLLREGNSEKRILEKVEAVIIPNDIWDARGKPNSFRVHIYGDKASEFRKACTNGSKVLLDCHLRRITLNKRDQEGNIIPGSTPTYAVEIVVENFEVLRKESTGYFASRKSEQPVLEEV